jgi:hypothetical protein
LQGSPLSPLPSNILLDDLDRELEKRGHRFCRYADDCNIHVRLKAAGERVRKSVTRFLAKRLRLQVYRGKSAVGRPWKRKFLGYVLSRHRGPKLGIASSSVQRAKAYLREWIRRGRGRSLSRLIAELTPFLRGWVNYFRLSQVLKVFADPWIRRKLRRILWRQ